MKALIFPGIAALLLTACASSSQPVEIAIIPQPARIVEAGGTVKIGPDDIHTTVDTTIANPEGYRLTVSGDGVEIVGGSDAGVFYGLQTLAQLRDSSDRVPRVTIEDAPRFPWRGMHLDVSRHFFSKDFIKKYLDILAYHKINTFHWHLTDGIGWRLQIDKYPLLTSKGAWRKVKDEQAPWIGFELSDESRRDSADTYGGYYTKDDVREILAYAKERHITVIPEIEMPGHSEAATYAYPEYICANAKPGSGVYCPGKEETFAYLEGILDEVIELFPDSPYIHIGGDEVGKDQWRKCPLCQKRMREEGLKDEHELQSYFVHRIEEYINSKGKAMIGWDEILEGGLAPNATVMSWTGFEGGIKAANAGHDVVMVPLDYVYFDHYQSRNACEPQAWGGLNNVKRVYAFEPVPPAIDPAKAHHVKGGQANVWTETILTPEHVEYMLLPRLAALSEVLWSDTTVRDWNRFECKLDRQYDRYADLGWNYAESAMNPYVSDQHFNADGSLTLYLATELDGYPIHYTLDGTTPTEQSACYTDSIRIDGPATLTAQTFRNGRPVGCTLTVPHLLNLATQAQVTYASPYSPAYTGRGDGGLTDNCYAFKRGDDPAWQGFERINMDITLDLGTVQTVQGVIVNFLQHTSTTSVILPTHLNVWISTDGKNFVQTVDTPIEPDNRQEVIIKPIDARFSAPAETRFIRIEAVNRGVLPAGIPRAGGPAWIFTDEVIVY